jgi:hypothetical protein
MVQDVSQSIPATQKTVDNWIAKYKCVYDVGVDTKFSIASGGTIGLPYNVIIDPRTMKVEKVIPGDGASVDSAVKTVLSRNGG